MGSELQSPVDIPASAPRHHDGIEWSYRPTPVVMDADHHRVQFECAPGSYLTIESVRYELVQFHLHSPAEHHLDGERAAMELHLVHESAQGALAVVAVWLVEGVANPAFDAIVGAPSATASKADLGAFDATKLPPRDLAYVGYIGSLTVPPFTEGVAWRVLVRPVAISKHQLGALSARHDGNSRPLQPLGDRSFDAFGCVRS
jgi:carbonic anhydrase